jgi:hypothetical protein
LPISIWRRSVLKIETLTACPMISFVRCLGRETFALSMILLLGLLIHHHLELLEAAIYALGFRAVDQVYVFQNVLEQFLRLHRPLPPRIVVRALGIAPVSLYIVACLCLYSRMPCSLNMLRGEAVSVLLGDTCVRIDLDIGYTDGLVSLCLLDCDQWISRGTVTHILVHSMDDMVLMANSQNDEWYLLWYSQWCRHTANSCN